MYPYFYFLNIMETMAQVQTSVINISHTFCYRWVGFNMAIPEFSILLLSRCFLLGFLLVEEEDNVFCVEVGTMGLLFHATHVVTTCWAS